MQVGNAYTFAGGEVGTVLKIGQDVAGCGAAGTFSTGISAKPFQSAVSIASVLAGAVDGVTGALLTAVQGSGVTAIPTLAGITNVDTCIKRLESLAVQARTTPQRSSEQPLAQAAACWTSLALRSNKIRGGLQCSVLEGLRLMVLCDRAGSNRKPGHHQRDRHRWPRQRVRGRRQ